MCPPHPIIWAQSLLETNFPEDVKVKGCGMEDWLKDRERGFQQKLTGVGQSCSEEALTLNLAGSKVLLNSHEHLRPGVPGTTATLHTPSQHTPDSSWSTGVSRPGWAVSAAGTNSPKQILVQWWLLLTSRGGQTARSSSRGKAETWGGA